RRFRFVCSMSARAADVWPSHWHENFEPKYGRWIFHPML
ncbi:hypothetical protein PGANDO_1079, partial [Porphyromonas gingivalis]